MLEFSDVEEMYLKTIFEVHSESPGAIVKTTQLANLMGLSAASVTEMIQRLSNRGMITHIPYRGCRLTTEGFQLAAKIKRREGLLEILLADVLGFKGDVKAVACRMEHSIDADLEATIDRFLGYPEMTSTGSRIPSIERNFETSGAGTLLPLSGLSEGDSSTIEIISANSLETVTIEGSGLGIGSIVKIKNSKVLCNGVELELSDSISMKILVRIVTTGD